MIAMNREPSGAGSSPPPANGFEARILSLHVGEAPGGGKSPAGWARFRSGFGLEGDNDSPSELRQVSLLPMDSLKDAAALPCAGHCGEHLRLDGVGSEALHVGDLVKAGKAVLLVTKLGRRCSGGGRECTLPPDQCPVAGNWVFARVLGGGQVCVGDAVEPATFADVPAGRRR